MIRRLSVVWPALARHLRPAELLRDLATLAAVGTLASFSILFVSRTVFDNVVHELSLDYSSRQNGPLTTPSDLTIRRYDDVVMAPASEAGGVHGDGTINVSALSVESATRESNWLRRATLAGGACADGVLVDQATANSFGVGVGDALTMWWPDVAGQATSLVKVCGIVNVWHPDEASGDRGYAVAPEKFLKSRFPAFEDNAPSAIMNYWFSGAPAGSQSKAAAVRGIIADQVGWSTAVVAIALAGCALWALAVARVWGSLSGSLESPKGVLARLGARPGIVAGFVGVLTTALSGASAAIAAVVGRTVLLAWTSLYVQPLHIVVVVAGLVTVAEAVIVWSARKSGAALFEDARHAVTRRERGSGRVSPPTGALP